VELKLNYNWERNPDVLGKMCVPVLLRSPEIPDVLPWYRSRAPTVESLSYGHCYALPNPLDIYTCYIFLIICLKRDTKTLKNSSMRILCILHAAWFESPLFIWTLILSAITNEHDLLSMCCLQFLCLCAPYVLRSMYRCFKPLSNDAVNYYDYTASVR
jgi:hypothetical protein